MSDKFKIGDRVVVVVDTVQDDNQTLTTGDTGTVVCFGMSRDDRDRPIGVNWDREVINGHACNGRADHGHGWYVFQSDVQLEYQNPEFEIESDEILSLCGGGL